MEKVGFENKLMNGSSCLGNLSTSEWKGAEPRVCEDVKWECWYWLWCLEEREGLRIRVVQMNNLWAMIGVRRMIERGMKE